MASEGRGRRKWAQEVIKEGFAPEPGVGVGVVEEWLMGRKGTCPEHSVPGAAHTLLSLCWGRCRLHLSSVPM